jgi:prepilin-type N-terminal cleavage/methylation domain-containing protein
MSQKGFTLVEMLVVIAIIAILASIFLVGLQGFRGSAYDARRLSDITNIQSKLELYYNQYGNYPATLKDPNLGSLPKDPQLTGAGADLTITGYYYCVATDSQSYIVGAKLSAANSATKNAIRSTTLCAPALDGGSGSPAKLDCGSANPSIATDQYCVGPGSSG